MKHRQDVHAEYVEGCFGCKVSTVGVATVPGGNRGPQEHKAREKQWKRDLESYAGARKAGLRPEASTRKAVERAEQRAEAEDRAARKIGVNNIKEAFQ